MALPCNCFSPIFPSSSSTTNDNAKQYGINAVTSSIPQKYQLDPHDVVPHEVSIIVDDYEEKIEKIKKLVEWRRDDEEDPSEGLMFVDAIQRLGVAHHYVKQIETIMEQHYLQKGNKIQSLRDVALSFRLLRHRGYHISADVFNNFKGKDGKFRDEVKQDIWGLVELYEATQLIFEGEDILEEAHDFSSQILQKHLTEDPKFEGSNMVKMRLLTVIDFSVQFLTLFFW